MHPQDTTHYPARIARTCIGCATIFYVPPSRLKYGPALWCNMACRYSTPGWHESVRPQARRIATCEVCGVQFEVVLSKIARYCSRRCLGVINGRRRAAQTRNQKLYRCAQCGKQFEAKACLAHRKRYCSRKCNGLAFVANRKLVRPTSIERALFEGLTAVGITAVPEHSFSRFSIDLAILGRQIAIEADGTYWHRTPAQKARDNRKNIALAAAGWTVLRFSEDRINTDLAGCVREVQALL